LVSGFWQVKVSTKDWEKTVFTILFGTNEFLVMPFELINIDQNSLIVIS
ncbi:4794_t:CDS:1, partial [Dentiscutata erythropus]